MQLVRVYVEHPLELRADMQRYFGLNISRCGYDYSPFHLAACVAALPLGSSTLAAIDHTMAYTLTERALLAYMGVDIDKQDESAIPEQEAMTVEEFWQWYSKPKKEVKDGGKRW